MRTVRLQDKTTIQCRTSALRRLATVAVLALGSGVCWGARDLTFIATSDLHYYGTNVNLRMQAYIDRINTLPGTAYPASVGGVVGPLSGVIMNGDVTDSGNPKEWELFTNDWGLAGEKRCKFPIYEGLGNHDTRGGDFMISNIVARNKSRPGLMNVSTNGLHYSWEWDGQRVPDPDYEHRRWPDSTLDLYDAGSLQDDGARPKWKPSGRFFVVRITDTNMTVVMNTPQGWGVPHSKTLSNK